MSAGVQSEGARVNRDDLCHESTVSLARRIRAGEVSPVQAVNAYLERIEAICGVPIALISTGADRDQTIVRAHPFEAKA